MTGPVAYARLLRRLDKARRQVAALQRELAAAQSTIAQQAGSVACCTEQYARRVQLEAEVTRLKQRDDQWFGFVFTVAHTLNCLPSNFPTANEHVLRKLRELVKGGSGATPPAAAQSMFTGERACCGTLLGSRHRSTCPEKGGAHG